MPQRRGGLLHRLSIASPLSPLSADVDPDGWTAESWDAAATMLSAMLLQSLGEELCVLRKVC